MLPDRVSNPGPLTYESGVLPIVLRGPADGKPTAPQRPGSEVIKILHAQLSMTIVGILTSVSRKNSILGLSGAEKLNAEYLDIFILLSI